MQRLQNYCPQSPKQSRKYETGITVKTVLKTLCPKGNHYKRGVISPAKAA